MTYYICVFIFKGNEYTIETNIGISDLKDGFWVTKELQCPKTEPVKYWIPPHKIQYIQKEKY